MSILAMEEAGKPLIIMSLLLGFTDPALGGRTTSDILRD